MYRLEVFDEQLAFISAALIQEQPIDLDFLTFSAFSLKSQKIKCKKGYIAHIAMEETAVDALVADVQPDDSGMTLSLRPLQALFDFEVFGEAIADVAQWIGSRITDAYIGNADTLQNRPVTVSVKVTDAFQLTHEGDTIKLLDVMTAAFKAYGIFCDCRVDFSEKKIAVSIQRVTATATLEADLPNVLSKAITLGDSYGGFNKIVIRKSVETDGAVTYPETVTYYLHPNGAVDTQDTDRITPVFWTIATIADSEEWTTEAQTAATEALTPESFDNEIVLKYAKTDALVQPEAMAVGTRATIWVEGTKYASMLTGIAYGVGTVELTFGVVRVALTKKLILERVSK